MTLLAGIRLGPHEILSPLGSGGMGVLRGHDDVRAADLLDGRVGVTPEANAVSTLLLALTILLITVAQRLQQPSPERVRD